MFGKDAQAVGSIGETKLKILAILYHNGLHGIDSYGYNV